MLFNIWADGKRRRLLYRHNRPSGGTEGNYTLLASA